MLRATVDRLVGVSGLARPIVASNAANAHLVRAELESSDPRLILEPVGRNTAPAVAAAALAVLDDDPVLFVLPSDHLVADIAAFKAAAVTGAELAGAGRLVTFGVVPSRPETGYGYIRAGAATDAGAFAVAAFVEKPEMTTAEGYVASGEYFWNSGMFMFTASRYLDELRKYEPEIVAAVERSMAGQEADDVVELDAEAFSACPSDSIDFAVMERTQDAVVVPLDAGWSDVGSWSALWDLAHRDAVDNATRGDVVTTDTERSLVWSESRLVATVGVENLVVVETPDAVLVVPRDLAQDVKDVVAVLRDQERAETVRHLREVRPWGSFEILDTGERYQVKRLVVNPGAKLSLQSHRHRAEEWTVVNGTARVVLDGDVATAPEGKTVSVPVGSKHRLENPGHIPLVVIEVQLGAYLGEDDIVRYDDEYGRS